MPDCGLILCPDPQGQERAGTGGVAQVLEGLLYKHEVLNSNPRLTKEKKILSWKK
jgi:hypothetical protein